MNDWFSDIPGWAKGTLLLLALGGTNGAQYLGFAAPVQENAVVAREDRAWCLEKLEETQKKLEECWKECRP